MEALALPLLAVVAGFMSFSSPCTLPLVPGYLAYVSGLPLLEVESGVARRTTLRAALLFVAGFTTVFTSLGASFAVIGSLLLRNVGWITRLTGVGIVVMGLAMVGVLRIPVLSAERRFDLSRIGRGPKAAFSLGMGFAFGWTPCVGPILATILALAGATKTVAVGAILLALYSIGLGIPFVIMALWYQRAARSVVWLRRHARRIETLGGIAMVGVGVLFVTGAWQALFIPLQRAFARLGWPPI
jgi:cytochrome c-type biogenesis protein